MLCCSACRLESLPLATPPLSDVTAIQLVSVSIAVTSVKKCYSSSRAPFRNVGLFGCVISVYYSSLCVE